MQKLKKALKKLAKFGTRTAPEHTASKAAKKASLTKKKVQAVPAKKAHSASAHAPKPAAKGDKKKAAPPSKAAKAAKPASAAGKPQATNKSVLKKAAAAKPVPKPSAKDDKAKKPGHPEATASVANAAPHGTKAKPASAKASGKAGKALETAGAAKAPVDRPTERKGTQKAASKPKPEAPAHADTGAEEPTGNEKTPAKAARAGERPAKGKRSDPRNEALAAVAAAATAEPEEEVILTDAEGRRYCRVKDCDQLAVVDAYCRYHYLLFWKNIQVRKKILSEGKLERYIEELTARYPDKYLEMLRKDLRNEKDFTAAIQELEIDDSGVDGEYEDEAQSYLEEVRGISSETPQERTEDDY
jgi:hypothetical protein